MTGSPILARSTAALRYGAAGSATGAGSITVWGDIAIKGINPGPVTLAILPAGGFITLGLLLALINHLQARAAVKSGRELPPPLHLDCRSCSICHLGK